MFFNFWTDFLTGWLIDWFDDWLIDWLIGWLIDWMIGFLQFDCLTNWLTARLLDQTIDWLFVWLIAILPEERTEPPVWRDCCVDWATIELDRGSSGGVTDDCVAEVTPLLFPLPLTVDPLLLFVFLPCCWLLLIFSPFSSTFWAVRKEISKATTENKTLEIVRRFLNFVR